MSKISIAEFRALPSHDGRGSQNTLRAVAEQRVAAHTAGVAASEGAGAGQGRGRTNQSAKKRFVFGIDPGVKTGFALWDREEKCFDWIETSTFWGVYFRITVSHVFSPLNTEIVIEVAHHAPTFAHLKAEGQNKHTLSKIARNVGQVTREAQLLVEGFRQRGFTVIEQKPLGKAKKAADDVRDFERLTGWTKQTSQHARDAARLCFQM